MAELRDIFHADESLVYDVPTKTGRVNPTVQDHISRAWSRAAAVHSVLEYADEGSPEISDYLQTAVDYARANAMVAELPYGVVELPDTLHMGRGVIGDPGLADTCVLRGRSPAYNGSRGSVLRASFTDRPAINFQYTPFGALENVLIAGMNILFPANGTNPHPSRNLSDYYISGLAPSRYTPYAGIAINAFGNTEPSSLPGGSYPNQPSGHIANGGGISIRGCYVFGFEVGIVVNPNGSAAGTGNTIFIGDKTNVSNCAYGVSLCDPNGRNVLLENTIMGLLHTCLTNNTHGVRGGFPPLVSVAEWNSCYQWLDMTAAVSAMKLEGVSGESMHRIGSWYGGQNPIRFEDCEVFLGAASREEAVLFVTSAPAKFNGTIEILDGSPGVLNTAGGSPVTWDQALFSSSNGIARDYNVGVGYPAYGGQSEFLRCQVRATAAPLNDTRRSHGSPFQAIDQDVVGRRASLSLSSSIITINADGAGNSYRCDCGNRGWVASSGTSSVVWNDEDEELTFTAVAAGEYLVGDILFGLLKSTARGLQTGDGQTVASRAMPMIRVTAVDGTSVTAEAIWAFEDIDQASSVGFLSWILPDQWAPYGSFTGTWTTGTTITAQQDPSQVVRAGDFLRAAAGLPSVVRVLSVDSTTITLSKSVSSARTTEEMYFGRLFLI